MVTIINAKTGEPVGYIDSPGDYSINEERLQRFIDSAHENGIGRFSGDYDEEEDTMETEQEILMPEDDGFLRALINNISYPYIPSLDVNKQDDDYQNREYIDDPSEAPDDVEVHEGEEEDTWFYYPEDRDREEREWKSLEEMIEEIEEITEGESPYQTGQKAGDYIIDNILNADPADLQKAVESVVDWDQKSFEVAAKSAIHEYTKVDEEKDASLHKPVDYRDYRDIEGEFRREHGSKEASIVSSILGSWTSGDLFTEETAPMIQLAGELTGNSNIHQRDEDIEEELFNTDITSEEKEAIRDYMNFDREKIKEKFGEEIPVFRGLDSTPSSWEDNEELDLEDYDNLEDGVHNGQDIEMEHSCVESWSTNPIEALRFADDGGIILRDWMNVDEVLGSANSNGKFVADQAEYIRMHEEESKVYENGENVFARSDVSSLSLAQSTIQMWKERKQSNKSKQSNSVFSIPGEYNQADWLEDLQDKYDYNDDSNDEKIVKYRVYIDDRSDAPDWADVQEGPQGGLYYDVGGPSGQARLGQPASEAPANVPEELDLRNVIGWKDWDDVEERPGAFSEQEMSIGITEDDERVFVTESGPPGEIEHSTISSNKSTKLVEEAIDESKLEDHEIPEFPKMHINEEIMSVVVEDAGEDDSLSASRYKWEELSNPRNIRKHDRDSFISAVALKALVGDSDVGANIVTSSDGKFYPIDFDLSGAFIPRKDKDLKENNSMNYDGYWDKVARGSVGSNLNVEAEEVYNRAKKIAEAIDTEWLESAFEEDIHATTERKRHNYLRNIELLRRGENK